MKRTIKSVHDMAFFSTAPASLGVNGGEEDGVLAVACGSKLVVAIATAAESR